jgi:hypothetical protein
VWAGEGHAADGGGCRAVRAACLPVACGGGDARTHRPRAQGTRCAVCWVERGPALTRLVQVEAQVLALRAENETQQLFLQQKVCRRRRSEFVLTPAAGRGAGGAATGACGTGRGPCGPGRAARECVLFLSLTRHGSDTWRQVQRRPRVICWT